MKKVELMNSMSKLGLLAGILAAAMPELSFAQAADVQDLVQGVVQEQLPVFPYALSAVCYVGGAFMMVSGALSLKKHAENPAAEPIGKGVGRLLTGGAITAVPAVAGIMQNTVFGSGVPDSPDFNALEM